MRTAFLAVFSNLFHILATVQKYARKKMQRKGKAVTKYFKTFTKI